MKAANHDLYDAIQKNLLFHSNDDPLWKGFLKVLAMKASGIPDQDVLRHLKGLLLQDDINVHVFPGISKKTIETELNALTIEGPPSLSVLSSLCAAKMLDLLCKKNVLLAYYTAMDADNKIRKPTERSDSLLIDLLTPKLASLIRNHALNCVHQYIQVSKSEFKLLELKNKLNETDIDLLVKEFIDQRIHALSQEPVDYYGQTIPEELELESQTAPETLNDLFLTIDSPQTMSPITTNESPVSTSSMATDVHVYSPPTINQTNSQDTMTPSDLERKRKDQAPKEVDDSSQKGTAKFKSRYQLSIGQHKEKSAQIQPTNITTSLNKK